MYKYGEAINQYPITEGGSVTTDWGEVYCGDITKEENNCAENKGENF